MAVYKNTLLTKIYTIHIYFPIGNTLIKYVCKQRTVCGFNLSSLWRSSYKIIIFFMCIKHHLALFQVHHITASFHQIPQKKLPKLKISLYPWWYSYPTCSSFKVLTSTLNLALIQSNLLQNSNPSSLTLNLTSPIYILVYEYTHRALYVSEYLEMYLKVIKIF